jgi:hypothetical protein
MVKLLLNKKYVLRKALSNCFRQTETITANGEDISFVTVSVVDKMEFFATATNQLFQVTGRVLDRACNGDATSLEMFHKIP